MIYKATEFDIESILAMANNLHNQHNWTGKFNINWKRKFLLDVINNPKFLVLVAKFDNEIVGYSIGYIYLEEAINQNRCIIQEIYVNESHRKQGIAFKMAEDIINWGRYENSFEILANVAIDNILGGHELFKKLGFKQRSIRFVKSLRSIS